MSDRFAVRAEEFIAKVQAAPLDPATEFVLVFHCVDQEGRPLPPVRIPLEPTINVAFRGDSEFARRFAVLLHRNTILANINALVHSLPEGPIELRGAGGDPLVVLVRDVSLEIAQPGDPVSLAARPDAPPLREDGKGGLRVGNSRVLLELVIQAHQDGDSPEAIVKRYPTLSLADVHGVIAFYLRHPGEVDEYMVRREQEARELGERIDKEQPPADELRARLLARRTG
jgi:uncharacterized protein (DUF433 family)